MPVTVTTRGWIELYRDGALVSRHNVESEAIERAVAHAEANGDGDYELRYPNKVLRVSLLQKTVIPFAWNTVAISFNQGTPASVNLASFLRNDQGYPITFGVLGSLPTGVTHAAGVLTYNGQGSPASAQATFTASSGPFVATSGSSSVAIADVNLGPYWSNAPATLSANAGAQVAFGGFANDPDGDVLTFSLVAHPGGYAINASTGAVTLGSSSGPVTMRATDPAGLYADHVCQVTVAVSSMLKWTPGHYAIPDAALLPSKLSQYTTLWNQIAPVANFAGGGVLIPWGQVETSQGVYDWSAVDAQISALAAIGKKTSLHIKFEVYTSSALPSVASNDANVNRYFPSYAIAAGHVVAARKADGSLAGRQELKYWNAAAVDRFLAFYSALATRYDNDERVVLISTPETSIAIDYPDPTSTWTNALTQWRRILAHLNSVLARTPVVVSNNFLQTETVTTSFQQEIIDSIAGCGGPDMFIPSLETSDNWGMRSLRGERYNGTAWIPGVAEDQTYKVAVSVQQQVVRSMSATPALYYDAAVNRYGNTHTEWWAKTTVYQYGHTNDPAYRIPAMDWVNVLAYIRDNDLPLRTTIPTGLA